MVTNAFFMMRLNDHIQYLKKVDAALKGQLDFQITSHTECKLGRWIYGEGVAEITLLKDSRAKEVFDSLIEPHARFHQISQQALMKKQQGDENAVRTAITEMHLLSTTLTNKLLELDKMK
jgi:hypothetical protein